MTLPAELARLGLALETDDFVRQGTRATRSLEDIKKAAGQTATELDRSQGVVADFVNRLKGFAAIAGIGFGVSQLIQYAETWKLTAARFKLATRDAYELAQVQEQVYQQAQKAGMAYEGQAQLFNRLSNATRGAGYSAKDLLTVSDATNAMLTITGTTAGEAAGALFQLSQGLASGALRGDEFNSVAENMPMILDILAKELGKPREQLRALAADGKITADVIISAFKKQNDELQKQAATIPMTIGKAFEQMKNVVVKAVGEFDKGFGVTDKIAKSIAAITENVGMLAKAVTALFAILALGTLPSLITRLTLLLVTMTGVTAGFTTAAAGATTWTFANTALGASLIGLRVAMLGFAGSVSTATIALVGMAVAAAPVILAAIMLAAPLLGIAAVIYSIVKARRDEKKAQEDAYTAAKALYAQKQREIQTEKELRDALAATEIVRSKGLATVLEETRRKREADMRVVRATQRGGIKAGEAAAAGEELRDQLRSAQEAGWRQYRSETKDSKKIQAEIEKYKDVWAAAAAGVLQAQIIIRDAEVAIGASTVRSQVMESAADRARKAEERVQEAKAAAEANVARLKANFEAQMDTLLTSRERIVAARRQLQDDAIGLITDPLKREVARLRMAERDLNDAIKEATKGLEGDQWKTDREFIANSMRNDFVLRQQLNRQLQETARREEAVAFNKSEVVRVTLAQAEAEKQRRLETAALTAERERQLRQPMENALKSLQSTFTDTFDKIFANQLKSGRDFAQSFVALMRRAAAETASAFLFQKIGQLLGGTALPTSLPGADLLPGVDLSDLLGSVTKASTSVGVYHSGGVVGAPAMSRRVEGLGEMNLRANEVPIIAQRGETVLPVGAAAGGGDVHQYTITVPLTVQALDATDVAQVLDRAGPKIQEIVLRGVKGSNQYAKALRGA